MWCDASVLLTIAICCNLGDHRRVLLIDPYTKQIPYKELYETHGKSNRIQKEIVVD